MFTLSSQKIQPFEKFYNFLGSTKFSLPIHEFRTGLDFNLLGSTVTEGIRFLTERHFPLLGTVRCE